MIIRRKKDKDGKETIEEIHIDKNGNKTGWYFSFSFDKKLSDKLLIFLTFFMLFFSNPKGD